MTINLTFAALLEIVRRAESKKLGLPLKEALTSSCPCIGFSLLQCRMLAPLNEVAEMLPVPEATKLPGVNPWIPGVANFRGRLLPLFDLEMFFSGNSLINNKKRRVLVLEIGDLYAGVIVNEVYGMQHLLEGVEFTPVPTELAQFSPYSKGCVHQDSIDWLTFSPFDLVKDPSFFNAALR